VRDFVIHVSPGTQPKLLNRISLIAVFSIAALLVHLPTNGRYGYFRDELYYNA